MSSLKIEASCIREQFPQIVIHRSDLEQFLSPEDAALFFPADLEYLGKVLREHFVVDWFPDELKALALSMLNVKQEVEANE